MPASFPRKSLQYDPWVIRECLHNCIAHQDYSQGGKINVVEESRIAAVHERRRVSARERGGGRCAGMLRSERLPEPLPGRGDGQPEHDRHHRQRHHAGCSRSRRQRNFPMPDYDLSERDRVKVRIIGKVIDEKYTRMLMARTDLDLWDVIALDKVQKGKPISDEEFRSLKAKKLVEGRRPNLFVSAEVAAATETKADYIKKRAFDKEHYKKMVVAYLKKFGEAKREDIDKLLWTSSRTPWMTTRSGTSSRTCSRRCGGKGSSGPSRGSEAGAKWRVA